MSKNRKMPHSPRLPAHIGKQGTALMNQQCWCWGKDIQREAGNALLLYGFTRQRPPEGEKGSSKYTLSLAPGCHLHLWGFGFWYVEEERGGIYLNRFRFEPQYTGKRELPALLWEPGQIPTLPMETAAWEECAYRLLPTALRGIGAYERWICATLGLKYREECVQSFRKPILSAEEMADAWECLADQIEALSVAPQHRTKNTGDVPYYAPTSK